MEQPLIIGTGEIPLGRRLRALKLWFVLRHYGQEGLAFHIREHVRLTEHLAQRIGDDLDFHLVVPRTLNLVCFTHQRGDEFTEQLMERLNASGSIYLSHTRLAGTYTIRMCVGGRDMQQRHVDAAWDQVVNTARELSEELANASRSASEIPCVMTDSPSYLRERIGLVLGPLVFLVFFLTDPPNALSFNAWLTAGMGLWMAIWWMSEALPIPITSLLPILLIPILGISSIREAAAPYANPLNLPVSRWFYVGYRHGKVRSAQTNSTLFTLPCWDPSIVHYWRLHGGRSGIEYVGDQYGHHHDDAAYCLVHHPFGAGSTR